MSDDFEIVVVGGFFFFFFFVFFIGANRALSPSFPLYSRLLTCPLESRHRLLSSQSGSEIFSVLLDASSTGFCIELGDLRPEHFLPSFGSPNQARNVRRRLKAILRFSTRFFFGYGTFFFFFSRFFFPLTGAARTRFFFYVVDFLKPELAVICCEYFFFLC